VNIANIFNVELQFDELMWFELLPVVGKKGHVHLIRDLFEEMTVNSGMVFKASHAIFGEVDLDSIFDLFDRINRQKLVVLVLKGAQVAITFKGEVLQEGLRIKLILAQVRNAVIPVLVFVAIEHRLRKEVADFLCSAASAILVFLPFKNLIE